MKRLDMIKYIDSMPILIEFIKKIERNEIPDSDKSSEASRALRDWDKARGKLSDE